MLLVERRIWRLWHIVRYPRIYWYDHRKWRSRPKPGDVVVDCRGLNVTVERYGETQDDLIFTDGHSASWMHCCGWPEAGRDH
jgi:hypothetical protein